MAPALAQGKLHASVLRRAVAYLGGAAELGAFLGIDEARIAAWLELREPLPNHVFLRLVDIVVDPELSGAFAFRARVAERNSPIDERRSAAGKGLQFRLGSNVARCPTCDGIDFAQVEPKAALTNVSLLRCLVCSHELPRGDLIVLAGKDAVLKSNAAIAALKRRQAAAREKKKSSS